MKKTKNEQTNSSLIPNSTMLDSSNPIYQDETTNLEKQSDNLHAKTFKLKAYHPKMMIAYKQVLRSI